MERKTLLYRIYMVLKEILLILGLLQRVFIDYKKESCYEKSTYRALLFTIALLPEN